MLTDQETCLMPELSRSESLITHTIKRFGGVFDHERLSVHGIEAKNIKALMDGIERFVTDAIKCDDCSSNQNKHKKSKDKQLSGGWRSAHMRCFSAYLLVIDCMSDQFVFSETLELFRAAVSAARLEMCSAETVVSNDPSCRTRDKRFLDSVAIACQRLYREEGYRQRFANERSSAIKLNLGCCDYIDSLFSDAKRLIVVRVDLHYAESIADNVTIDRATSDLARLLANVRHNAIFRGLKGYVAKLECGIFRGFHWHVLFFLDARIRNPITHSYIGQTIGDYWREKITKGQGTYWNSNGDVRRFEALGCRGIGLVEKTDMQAIKNLKRFVVGYLTKPHQHAQPRDGRWYRTFRRGPMPRLLSSHSVDAKVRSG